MYTNHVIMPSTKSSSDKINQVRQLLQSAEGIVIGAGAGLSASAGLTYEGRRFTDHFSDLIPKYHFRDMYCAGFYPFGTEEEKWAYWSRHILLNRYDQPASKPYGDLLELVRNKDYFVITTNVDHQFQLAGFGEDRLFATQGDYGLFQCKKACHNKLYSNEQAVRTMVQEQIEGRIPSARVPKCPVCGGRMEVHLRCDRFFVEDEAWHQSHKNYQDFLSTHATLPLVFLELGVGMNTPGIIKIPFLQMAGALPRAHMAVINQEEFTFPIALRKNLISLTADIGDTLVRLLAP